MGFISALKNLHHSLIPTEVRADGGTFIETLPALAVSKTLAGLETTAGTKAWAGYGGLIELLAATANTTECWIEGIMVSDLLDQAGAADTGTVDIAITMEAGTGVPTPAQIEAEISAYLACGATGGPFAVYQPITPPIHIPRNSRIACAMNSISVSKTGAGITPDVDVRLQISRNKIQA